MLGVLVPLEGGGAFMLLLFVLLLSILLCHIAICVVVAQEDGVHDVVGSVLLCKE